MSDRLDLETGGAAHITRAGDQAPLVVLLPAISGINPYIKSVADDLAGSGFTVAALDYWARGGGVPDMSSMDKVMAAVAAVRDPDIAADIRAVCEAVDAPKRAVLGFCIGGSEALLAAANVDGLDAAVAYYGLLRYQQTGDAKPEAPIDAAQRIDIPVLGHWGDNDHLVAESDVHDLRKVVSGKPAEVYLYPGAGHAFHERFRPEVYRPIAATDSWARTRTFLAWHLTGE